MSWAPSTKLEALRLEPSEMMSVQLQVRMMSNSMTIILFLKKTGQNPYFHQRVSNVIVSNATVISILHRIFGSD
jgi:hypothetical protein